MPLNLYSLLFFCFVTTFTLHAGTTLQVKDYFEKCNAIAPTETFPLTKEEYQNSYSNLEKEIKAPLEMPCDRDDAIVFSIQRLLKDHLKVEVPADQVILMKGGLGTGLSGNRIYKIVDKDKKPLFAIKVFKGCSGDFSREFFALKNFERFLCVPSVVEIDACAAENTTTFFLVMTYIEGSTLHSLLRNFIQAKEKTEKEKLFKTLIQAYVKLGDSFAAIHNATKTKPLPLHPIYLDELDTFSQRTFPKLASAMDPNLLQSAKEYFSSHFARIRDQLFVRNYLHGDTNPANFIYNKTTDRLWMIDLIEGTASVGKNGLAVGPPGCDVMRILNKILQLKDSWISEKEGLTLRSAFLSHYTAAGGVLPSKEVMDFVSFLNYVDFLLWYHDISPTLSEREQVALKKESLWVIKQLETLVRKP
jgi:aminoglycoside phosphotransferase (APT) family kinase protein